MNTEAPEDVFTLLQSSDNGSPLDCTLQALIDVRRLAESPQGAPPRLVVMGLHERLIAQFPDISSRVLMISLSNEESAGATLADLPGVEWWGPRGKRPTLFSFVRKEFARRRMLLGATCASLFAVLASIQDGALMLALNQLIIGSITLFISTFLIFSVGESSRLTLDLFKSGSVHEFVQTDRHLAQTAVLALVLAFSGVALLKLPPDASVLGISLPNELDLGGLHLNALSFTVPLTTALAAALVVNVYTAAVRYYFDRHELLLEAEAARTVFRRHSQKRLRVEEGGQRDAKP